MKPAATKRYLALMMFVFEFPAISGCFAVGTVIGDIRTQHAINKAADTEGRVCADALTVAAADCRAVTHECANQKSNDNECVTAMSASSNPSCQALTPCNRMLAAQQRHDDGVAKVEGVVCLNHLAQLDEGCAEALNELGQAKQAANERKHFIQQYYLLHSGGATCSSAMPGFVSCSSY